MRRACSLKSFMLLLTAFLACVSAATIVEHGQFDGKDDIETKPSTLARQRKPTKLTTKTPLPNQTTLIAPTTNPSSDASVSATGVHREFFYHPAVVSKPRLIERYDKRALDGHYEYRYVLSNGDVRYERAYWQPVGHKKVLARKGFYSYPMPNHRFHTVFYTADHMGFHEDESTVSRTQPLLPRSLEVPLGSEKVAPAIEQKVQKLQVEEVQTNKINRKPNWTPTTKSILQKGRIAAIVGQDATKPAATATATATTTTVTVKRETPNGRRRASATAATASSATNRPQINKEKVSEPKANAISVSSGMTTTTTTKPTTPTTTVTMMQPPTPLTISEATEQISAAPSETINPIKIENAQTHAASAEVDVKEKSTAATAMGATAAIAAEAETEQLATVDTAATVLSVD